MCVIGLCLFRLWNFLWQLPSSFSVVHLYLSIKQNRCKNLLLYHENISYNDTINHLWRKQTHKCLNVFTQPLDSFAVGLLKWIHSPTPIGCCGALKEIISAEAFLRLINTSIHPHAPLDRFLQSTHIKRTKPCKNTAPRQIKILFLLG